MNDILKLAKELNGLLWSMSADYHDLNYDKIGKAQSIIDELVEKIKKEQK